MRIIVPGLILLVLSNAVSAAGYIRFEVVNLTDIVYGGRELNSDVDWKATPMFQFEPSDSRHSIQITLDQDVPFSFGPYATMPQVRKDARNLEKVILIDNKDLSDECLLYIGANRTYAIVNAVRQVISATATNETVSSNEGTKLKVISHSWGKLGARVHDGLETTGYGLPKITIEKRETQTIDIKPNIDFTIGRYASMPHEPSDLFNPDKVFLFEKDTLPKEATLIVGENRTYLLHDKTGQIVKAMARSRSKNKFSTLTLKNITDNVYGARELHQENCWEARPQFFVPQNAETTIYFSTDPNGCLTFGPSYTMPTTSEDSRNSEKVVVIENDMLPREGTIVLGNEGSYVVITKSKKIIAAGFANDY